MKVAVLLKIAMYLAIIAIVTYLSLNASHFYQIGGKDAVHKNKKMKKSRKMKN